ncbi:uncharacterized protein LOC142162338 [Nicotiana tabacum]|uniref:Uncharacterized protein LOC142162338 n=1 Tax=Nicotiana tabacum TaxID=4097 RepID=A0AC58RPY9_TOBAC
MDNYSQQPWKPSVAPLPIPKKFKMPDIPKYDGTTDPRDHITTFTIGVKGNDLTKQDIESVLVKKFGSSVNIILLRVVNEMQANDKLVPKTWTLSGFDNYDIGTKGEIILATFAEGVVKDTKFQVIDMDMAYNVILGRLRIHEMYVVPSTLHQVIKFPSQWGIRQIHGDQQASQNINSVADSGVKNDIANEK